MNQTVNADWSRLPNELKGLNQWCVAGPDKAPYFYDGVRLRLASNTNPAQWHDFQTVCKLATHYGAGIGFVLSSNDPLTCVDLDVKDATSIDKKTGLPVQPAKWTKIEVLEGYSNAIKNFNSYTELSTSGKGVHIWVLGDIGQGTNRGGVEVYSRERFIVCTGAAVSDVRYHIGDNVAYAEGWPGVLPIANRQELLHQLKASLRENEGRRKTRLVEVEEEFTDKEIVERAMGASNGHKFNDLCNGQWEQMGFPSQSEADLALMSMFTFYSDSNAQCRRLFRMTALGKREKAVKDDRYVNFTLEIIRGRQEKEKAAQAHGEQLSKQLIERMQKESAAPVEEAVPTAVEEYTTNLPKLRGNGIQWPPGLVGAIAGFIYRSSPRPVPEVSIVAAMGLIAGICGKAFNIGQTGLNVYITLVARSGIGKEAMHSGVSHILARLREVIPIADRFVSFDEYASGPALIKACADTKSFVNISGEWGRKLKRLSSEDGKDGPMQQLRTVMTNLYQKSGTGSVAGGLTYSDKDKNISSVSGVAYSMIGETTPKTFFESLTPSMMEDGFMSRITIVEYKGLRPKENKNQITQMDPSLVDGLGSLIAYAASLIDRYQTVQVSHSEQSLRLFNEFNDLCDDKINSSDDESFRQMWNRAHLKAMRLAALLAVADNWLNPIISEDHAQWGLDVVRRDIETMSSRLEEGDIGGGDFNRERKVISIMRDYLALTKVSSGYKVPEEMKSGGIIPRKFIQARVYSVTSFITHRLGSTAALDLTLKSLVDSGYLMEMDKNKIVDKYGFHGKCYRILQT